MPLQYDDLAIKDRNGRRVAVNDCRIEPLNLLIPGMAPILVPKRNAWRSPAQQAQDSRKDRRGDGGGGSSKKVRLQLTDYEDDDASEAEEEEEEEDDEEDTEDDYVDTKPLLSKKAKTQVAKGSGGKCRKDSVVKEKAREAKHSRRADRHEKRAVRERQEAAADREKLQRRIEKQEAYVAKLKARYQGGGDGSDAAARDKAAVIMGSKRPGGKRDKAPTKSSSSKKKPAAAAATNADASDGATTDGSAAAVREMLNNMKIRAGGAKAAPRFHVEPDDVPWTPSEDAQLWNFKEGNEQWADIAKLMGRRPGEVKRRYKYLKEIGYQVPGGNEEATAAETTEAEQTGEAATTDANATAGETTDAEKTGAETTDAEAAGGETTDAEAAAGGETTDADADKPKETQWTTETDTQLWKLKDAGKTWAEIHDEMGIGKSDLKKRYKTLKTTDFKPSSSSFSSSGADQAAAAAAAPPAEQSPGVGDHLAKLSAYVAHQKRVARASPPLPPGAAGTGAASYIAQYSRNLLADACRGRARLPEPDEVFDETDCLLLALAESRRREHRWLEIQADFVNVTGRLVPVEILKWKLGRGNGEKADGEEDEDENEE